MTSALWASCCCTTPTQSVNQLQKIPLTFIGPVSRPCLRRDTADVQQCVPKVTTAGNTAGADTVDFATCLNQCIQLHHSGTQYKTCFMTNNRRAPVSTSTCADEESIGAFCMHASTWIHDIWANLSAVVEIQHTAKRILSTQQGCHGSITPWHASSTITNVVLDKT